MQSEIALCLSLISLRNHKLLIRRKVNKGSPFILFTTNKNINCLAVKINSTCIIKFYNSDKIACLLHYI